VKLLEIEFSSTAIYRYFEVPEAVWLEFQKHLTSHPGRFFAEKVRSCYAFECVWRPKKEKPTHAEDQKKDSKQTAKDSQAPRKRIA